MILGRKSFVKAANTELEGITQYDESSPNWPAPPQVVITVVLEHAGKGSKKIVPIFRHMAEAYLTLQTELGHLPPVRPHGR